MLLVPSLNRGLVYPREEVEVFALSRTVSDTECSVLICGMEDEELNFMMNEGRASQMLPSQVDILLGTLMS